VKTVTLISKKECHLCDVAKELLLKIHKRIPFMIDERKIEPGDTDFAEYAERVPVVLVDGIFAFQYRFTEQQLVDRLNSSGSPSVAS